mmetsp:Transcript_779/g.2110  ORF Transcript_779/g.2110 Transcript_779/m.2110 type:complete len:152 (-) Transcript_779:322-777(-)
MRNCIFRTISAIPAESQRETSNLCLRNLLGRAVHSDLARTVIERWSTHTAKQRESSTASNSVAGGQEFDKVIVVAHLHGKTRSAVDTAIWIDPMTKIIAATNHWSVTVIFDLLGPAWTCLDPLYVMNLSRSRCSGVQRRYSVVETSIANSR